MKWGARCGWALGTVILFVVVAAGTAGAQTTGPCVVTVDETSASAHTAPGSAYEVDANDSLLLGVVSQTGDPITAVRVELQFGPVQFPLTDQAVDPAPVWAGRYNVADAATLGVGLYRVESTAQLASGGTCTGAMWFDVTGRSPFTTVAGVGGTVIALLGLALAISGLRRAAHGEGGLISAVAGGAFAGIGALVVAQQSGMVPIDGDSVMLWIAAPGAGGAVLQQIIARVGGRTVDLEVDPEKRLEVQPAGTPDRAAPGRTAPPRPAPSTAPPPQPTRASVPTRPATPGAGSVGTAATPTESFPPVPPETAGTSAAPAPEPVASTPTAVPADAEPPPPPPPPAPSEAGPRIGLGILKGRRKRTASAPTQPATDTGADTATDDAAPTTITATGEVAPPRSAYARLDCPDVVVRDTEFELEVGLAATQSKDVVGDELHVPASVTGPYTLTVQIVADGFELRAGESWRVELPVTGAQPYPSATLHLMALGGDEAIAPRAIRAMFSVAGQTMGMAFRSIVVVRNLDLLGEPAVEDQEPGVDFSLPTSVVSPDLTVRIIEGESENGRLLWTFDTPWWGISVPDEPVVSHVGNGEEPRTFARRLVDAVNAREGKPGLYQYLVGVARSVADQMPEAFWALWGDIAERTGGRPPSILILSEEPYIPWELAETRPVIDDAAPPFLSAQAAVGRWVLGHRRPPLPPPREASITPMAVIWGVYNRPGWNRLVKAEEEAAKFTDTYGAVTVNAAANDVLKCLEGTPPADLMHFAVHGIYDPAGTQDGLVLTDGHVLDPLQVKGSTFAGAPFVFLNACQVGSGNKVLGDYAGLAEAFLYSGAAAVVAPLWSVQDTIAKELALYFYEKAFAGEGVGEVLRRQRALFTKSDDPISATYLAYQYFGHPQMKLTRVLRTEEGAPWQSSTQTGTQSASATS